MSQRLKARLRPTLILGIVLLFVYIFFVREQRQFDDSFTSSEHAEHLEHDNLLLDETQCARTFPGLTKEIDDAIAEGPFDLPFKPGVVLQGKVEDGHLMVISVPRKGELAATMRHRQSAILQQLNRAIITSPEPLPDIFFAFDVHDQPASSLLAFARPVVNPSNRRILPMPHFSFWSWPLPFISSLPAARRAITDVEAEVSFKEKDGRAVWRGTTWFNNGAGAHPRLRQDLVSTVPKDATWADVQALDWNMNSRDAANALRIEDFCRHRYIIHTEGIGYSGRLQFHQLCASVVLTPALEWMQHTTHLVRPVHSSTLLGREPHASARVREGWPAEYSAGEANMVFVAPDWSDLEDTVQWLESHLDVAEGIARRQRRTYGGGGYLGPAAEVCYWRALIRGWGKVARPTGEGWQGKGVPFEEFITGREDGKE